MLTGFDPPSAVTSSSKALRSVITGDSMGIAEAIVAAEALMCFRTLSLGIFAG